MALVRRDLALARATTRRPTATNMRARGGQSPLDADSRPIRARPARSLTARDDDGRTTTPFARETSAHGRMRARLCARRVGFLRNHMNFEQRDSKFIFQIIIFVELKKHFNTGQPTSNDGVTISKFI